MFQKAQTPTLSLSTCPGQLVEEKSTRLTGQIKNCVDYRIQSVLINKQPLSITQFFCYKL